MFENIPSNRFFDIDVSQIETPCFIIDEEAIEKNLEILDKVQREANCKILLALKAYAAYPTFHLIKQKLAGVCAGSLHEAKLGKEKFGKEVHTYSPAFKESEFDEILDYSDRVIFNSFSQFEKFLPLIKQTGKQVQIGLRVNPEKPVAGALFGVYDPCSENSRLGITLSSLEGKNIEQITGLHFHALCEQGVDELEMVLEEFDRKFQPYLKKMQWVNFGGGHYITKENYDVDKLIYLITNFRKKYPNIKEVYLEPGEAIVLNSGILVSSVLDIVKNKKNIAILDTSVETHFPDVLITRNEPQPYVPCVLNAELIESNKEVKYENNYTLAGVSCAAGDVFGDYSFQHPLKIGDKVIFLDTAYYSMVKTSTFCGVPLPSIALRRKTGKIEVIKKFGYNDYKEKLG